MKMEQATVWLLTLLLLLLLVVARVGGVLAHVIIIVKNTFLSVLSVRTFKTTSAKVHL